MIATDLNYKRNPVTNPFAWHGLLWFGRSVCFIFKNIDVKH